MVKNKLHGTMGRKSKKINIMLFIEVRNVI